MRLNSIPIELNKLPRSEEEDSIEHGSPKDLEISLNFTRMLIFFRIKAEYKFCF